MINAVSILHQFYILCYFNNVINSIVLFPPMFAKFLPFAHKQLF